MILTHYSKHPWQFDPHFQYPKHRTFFSMTKPIGLWLSDDRDEKGSWPAWCDGQEFRIDHLAHRKKFHVAMDRVCHLKDYLDIASFTELYTDESRYSLDWPQVKRDYAGLLITPYVWEARLEFMWYYGWDCASACIWDLSVLTEVQESLLTEIREIE